MQLHQLKPIHKKKNKKRVGRGGGRGTYSGKGLKGQKARAGRKLMPVIRETIKRYPKLKGYRKKTISSKKVVVNVGVLEKKFEKGETVSPKSLLEKRIIRRIKGRIPKVKILAKSDITKPLVFEKCLISQNAKNKIEKAGGTIKS